MDVHIVYVDMSIISADPGNGEPILEVYTDHVEAQKAKEEIEGDHPDVGVHVFPRPLHGPSLTNETRNRVWDAVHRIENAARWEDGRKPPKSVAEAIDEILAAAGVPDRVAELDE